MLRNGDECCDENRDENRYENRFERGLEFKCVFESRCKGRVEYGFEYGSSVYSSVLHADRECCVRAMINQLRVDNRDCERMQVQMAHTSVALDKTNASAYSAVFHTLRAGNECRQVESSRIVAIG